METRSLIEGRFTACHGPQVVLAFLSTTKSTTWVFTASHGFGTLRNADLACSLPFEVS